MGFANDISPEFLWCKDKRHAWDPDSLVSREVFNRRTERWEIHRTVRCDHCGTVQTERLTKSFQRLGSPTYEHPPGYKVEGYRGYVITAKDRAQIRALSTAMHGGTTKVAKNAGSNVTPIRKRRKRA